MQSREESWGLLKGIFVLFIILYGVKKRVNVYDSFLEGAKEGLITVFHITPTIMAMVFAVNIFLDSKFLDGMLGFLKPLFDLANIPIDILPMALLRPISGSASMAVATDIIKMNGVDSFIGVLAAVIMGSTETTLYTIAVYSSSVKAKNTRFVLFASLIADITGVIVSVIIVSKMFG